MQLPDSWPGDGGRACHGTGGPSADRAVGRIYRDAVHCPPASSSGPSQMPASSLAASGLAEVLAVGQFTFVHVCHMAFQHLGDGRPIDLVIGRLLGAVVHFDTGLLAVEFETGASVGILEAAPAAAIEHQKGVEIACAAFDIAEHLLEGGSAAIPQTAPALVAIDPNELHVMVACIRHNGFELLAELIALELRR